eukprot:CAMPEP_0198144552 /NCGR_PEP_ID=MMETSP1443-20131203/16431_1 /TAXON_ID=186043 /ORGANISM="Entomoneis sp., Strain CCMP2396" /LENGTH=300 /DNA_ID=CAMNT_0043807959 /DNA_START=101 /DNA_END=1003 /DNA_ORIENTATION=-
MDEDELKEKIEDLIPRVNLESTGLKQFVNLLSEETGINLKAQKDFIKKCLMAAMEQQKQQENASSEEEESEEEEEVAVPTKKKKGAGGGGGLSAQKEVSKALSVFLGKGKTMARTEIVKSLWEYIRDNDLQNPENKKEILLDSRMQEVFGCTRFTMFTMNKYISAHVHPFKPVDLTSSASKTTTPKKQRKRKGAAGDSTDKKKRKAGSQPPYRLSETLQQVVGVDILPRPQVVSKIWQYIKARDLQNPKDKREILCDAPLSKVMGGKKTVTMFNMNQFITQHLLEKLDKSEYKQPDDDSE